MPAQLFPDQEFTFKHALTHDVAYAGLLGERRRELHAAVVNAIERLHEGRLVEHVERLAHHARQAEVWDKAVRYLRQAGTKVFLRSANREAATCFEQALDALRRLPETPDTIAESLDLRFDLRNALLPLGELGRIGTLLDEAEDIADAVGDQRRLGQGLNYKIVQFRLAGDFGAAIQAGLRAVAIGESLSDVALQVVANGYLGIVYVARGECREGIRHGEAALALIPESLAQEHFGQAALPASAVRFSLAAALGALGRFAEAFGRLREAMHIAEEAGHVYSLLPPLLGLGIVRIDQGDFAGSVAPLERGLELCRTREVPLLLHDFAWALGAAYHGNGRHAEGIALMEDATRGFVEGPARYAWWPGRFGALGGAYLLDGRRADATRIAQEALTTARQRGEREVEARLLRLLGDIDIAVHPDRFEADAAEAHYRQALGLAEALGLRPLVAHCHLGLGKLYQRTGTREHAREHLSTATTMYREMDMRFYLEQAEAEMRELA
jgi:tetratricopeptide (TPR) repeat protein